MKPLTRLIIGAVTVATLALTALSGCANVDCIWAADTYAWIDVNENGTWDEGEAPLPGVTITAEDRNGQEIAAPYPTDDTGHAPLFTLTSCSRYRFNITAEQPDGYRFTTPESVATRETAIEVYFGFAPEN